MKAMKALVTGGTRGIGLAISDRLRQEGIEVRALSSKDCDLSDAAKIQAFLNQHQDEHFDILINNAGENIIQSLSDIDLVTWNRILTVNLTASFLLAQFFSRKMVQEKYGRIVNIASIFSFLSREGRASYATSKSGLLGLTRTSAVELAQHNVMVNAVSPGYVDTDLTRKNNSPEKIQQICETIPARRMGRTEEIAELVVYLASQRNSYLTGQNIVIDGGFSLT